MKKIFLFFIILLFLFFFYGPALTFGTAPVVCPAPPPDPSWSNVRIWNEYRCENNNCGGNRLFREVRQTYGKTCLLQTTPRDPCPTYSWSCTSFENNPIFGKSQVLDTAPSWAICQQGKTWSREKPLFGCAGACLKIPENPRYFDNPNFPTDPKNPEPSLDPTNIFLPVKLDWDDVDGWGKELGPQSYIIKITGKDGFPVLTKSEYNPRDRGPCFLKSGTTYNWQVQACCNLDGTNCGPVSDWQFQTNNAPEPTLPLDPDWMGRDLAKDQALDLEIRWCDVFFERNIRGDIIEEAPMSFKLFFYLGRYEPNKEEITIRHPWIGEHPKILSAAPRQLIQPHYLNEKYGFFTKSPFFYKGVEYNFYAWRVAACRRVRGFGECTNFSQKWRFSLKDVELKLPELISPMNRTDVPVRFPVAFEWSRVLGAKSYFFEIKENGRVVTSTITSLPNFSLDHPPLSVNTIYQWRVRACSDFEGRRCEPRWSSYSFKTTGQPPRIETMKPQGKNIPIPTFFEWEKVPGAKSYIFNIQGEDLNKELITEEPEVLLEFPDLRQEITYTWQVRTCAIIGGKLCGEPSASQTFTTFKIKAPDNLIISPHKENQPTIVFAGDNHRFLWRLLATAHQFEIIYRQRAADEQREKCINLEQQTKREIRTESSYFYPLECRGKYQWRVRGCLSRECDRIGSGGSWSDWQNITLTARIAPEGFGAGLIPCGRRFDNPRTQWIETNRCELKHLFVMLYLILNFFLWTIIPIALVILVVATGAMLHFSLAVGTDETLPKIKELWRAAGIGLGIIFFAWIFVSWVLTIFGYQLGLWYRIPIF